MSAELWPSISSAPRDGTHIRALTADGDIDVVCWLPERTCMLGRQVGAGGAGQRGPGWVSVEAEYLPVDEPTHWAPITPTVKEPQP